METPPRNKTIMKFHQNKVVYNWTPRKKTPLPFGKWEQ